MANIILGLLLLQPMSGYEITTFIKKQLSLICSSSAGSLQIALNKLLDQGYISYHKVSDGGKYKKIYSIEEAGKQHFHQWIAQPMQPEKTKDMQLSKLFFLGFASPLERKESIQAYIQELKQTMEILVVVKNHFNDFKNTQTSIEQDVLQYQTYTIEYGIASCLFEIEFYQNLCQKMEEES
ncbi:MAG: helix-turn-helix transcriptional regulator [Erysipelotrichaceae bacterium]